MTLLDIPLVTPGGDSFAMSLADIAGGSQVVFCCN